MQIFQRPSEQCVRRLLVNCDLPTADLEAHHFENFLGCGSTEDPKGIVGLEIFDEVALLRSLAVADEVRSLGCGKALVAAAESYAKAKGVWEIYLLTTTADRFFSRLGYDFTDRSNAPVAIKGTREFSGLCPDDSAFMMKRLGE